MAALFSRQNVLTCNQLYEIWHWRARQVLEAFIDHYIFFLQSFCRWSMLYDPEFELYNYLKRMLKQQQLLYSLCSPEKLFLVWTGYRCAFSRVNEFGSKWHRKVWEANFVLKVLSFVQRRLNSQRQSSAFRNFNLCNNENTVFALASFAMCRLQFLALVTDVDSYQKLLYFDA